jgi:hypothetical protein
VADENLLPGAVTGEQVECQAAVAAPVRVDRQSDVSELIDQSAQGQRGGHEFLPGDGVIQVGLAADQRISQATPTGGRLVLGWHQPVAAQRFMLGAANPDLSVHRCGAPVDGQHRVIGQMQSDAHRAGRAVLRLERDEAAADRAGEGTHET